METYIENCISFLPEIKQKEFKSLIENVRKEHKHYLINKLMITTLKETMLEKADDELSSKVLHMITNYEMENCKNDQDQSVMDLIGLHILDNEQIILTDEEIEKLHLIIDIRLNEKVNKMKNRHGYKNSENTAIVDLQSKIINDIKELTVLHENFKKSATHGEKLFSDFQQLLTDIDQLREDIDKSTYFHNLLLFTRLRSLDYQLKSRMFFEDEDTEKALVKLEVWYDTQLSVYKAKMDNATHTLDEYNQACLSPEYKNLLKEYINLENNIKEKENLLKEFHTSDNDIIYNLPENNK